MDLVSGEWDGPIGFWRAPGEPLRMFPIAFGEALEQWLAQPYEDERAPVAQSEERRPSKP